MRRPWLLDPPLRFTIQPAAVRSAPHADAAREPHDARRLHEGAAERFQSTCVLPPTARRAAFYCAPCVRRIDSTPSVDAANEPTPVGAFHKQRRLVLSLVDRPTPGSSTSSPSTAVNSCCCRTSSGQSLRSPRGSSRPDSTSAPVPTVNPQTTPEEPTCRCERHCHSTTPQTASCFQTPIRCPA